MLGRYHEEERELVAVGARGRSATKTSYRRAAKPAQLMIAVGIGLHNFSEGLAIGQSAAGPESCPLPTP